MNGFLTWVQGGALMAIGAAKRATAGLVTGIDIWATDDLSGNTAARARRNAELEDVAARVEILDGDVRTLTYPDATFDVIVSTLCIRNIGKADQMQTAILEIARALKSGGTAIISDLANTDDYARWFTEAGLKVSGPLAMKQTFPPQKAVIAKRLPLLDTDTLKF
jgi:arsenite methyltransferase